jgi:hypothetical protein
MPARENGGLGDACTLPGHFVKPAPGAPVWLVVFLLRVGAFGARDERAAKIFLTGYLAYHGYNAYFPYRPFTALREEMPVVPSVELSPQTFARLQAHAVPLVDNIETVISRLIDFYEARDGVPASTGDAASEVRRFNPLSPPALTHTKVLAIEFCGRPLQHGQANWNGLLNAAVREAKAHAQSASELKQLVIIPFVEGQKTNEGYRFLPDIGISVQGQDANGAWKAACHIAQRLGLALSATFVWREEKKGAAFPGVTGRLSIQAR